MATNVEALKNLYVTLGGNAADVADLDSNSEMIEALRNVAGGGGGGGVFTVTFTTTDGETWTCDKTYAQVKSALESGAFINGRAIVPGDEIMQVTTVFEIGVSIDFRTVLTNNGGTAGVIVSIMCDTWRLNDDDTVVLIVDEKTF